MAKATARAIGRNRNVPRPGMRASGASTSSVQQLATSSGMATSLAPRNAASCGLAPSPRWRCVFSRQMMALSTSGPMASDRPASVITLIVLPVSYRPMIAASTAIGNGQDGDQRHPPLAQEEQDHQRAEDRAQDAFLDQALDRVPDVDRLVHDDLQVDVGVRQLVLHLRHGLLAGRRPR